MTDAFKAEAGGLHSSLRRRFLAGETRGYEWRRKQLKTLGKLLEEHSDSLIGAIVADLKRPWSEAAMEVKILQREINDALRNLRSWMRPTWHWTHMLVAPAKQEARPEPLGSALVIGPYNYPVNLLISPLIGALSAGCNVMLKPSEISKSCERLFSELIPRYFEREDVCCVTGGVPETTTILALNWDFVFFTGSRKVGKVVASACAQHLTPNVLELGGKAAALVDSSVTSVTEAAKRIVWTKFVNAGQTCMCPDYVICHESVVDELCEELLRWTKTFYGESPKASPDFARLVSPAHARHVVHMLEESDGEVLCGGLDAADEEACYVPPTIIKNPTLGRSAVLSKEIFGPVLPVITFSTFEDSVDKITTIDAEPLALYIFSGSTSVQERYLAQVRSGDAIINDCFVQVKSPTPTLTLIPTTLNLYLNANPRR
uniref:Aldehyde dehydrogenase n=1 Tax=Phaeomonas parva TaxID=124430 RepID=A0A7S1XYP6_9STRA